MVEMGNAKFDGIYQAMQRKHYLGKWRKLKGKITVLLTTTHGINNESEPVACTFDLYVKTIFDYAAHNQEIGIIFRPHPALVREMLMFGF